MLGEGSFLNLLAFLERHAPDPVTRQVPRLALVDEARHVAFGLAHLEHQAEVDPSLRGRLRAAVERRHDALADTAGLNDEVFDALVLLAAGSWDPVAIGDGHRHVQRLQADMDEGRQRRLVRLGFPPGEAAALSALHTAELHVARSHLFLTLSIRFVWKGVGHYLFRLTNQVGWKGSRERPP